jgi:CRISPR-associated protein Csb2
MEKVTMALARHPQSMLHPKGQTLRFALSGARPQSPRCVVPLTNAWRAALLAAFEVFNDRPGSFLFSGRCADGTPDSDHAHAFYLPEVDDEGTIMGLRIVSPLAPFSLEEMRALRSVVTVTWAGPSARANLMLMEEQDTSVLRVASSWESTTPYVPPRAFHQDKPRLTPERQLADELRRDLGGAVDVVGATCTPVGKVPVRSAPNRGTSEPASIVARIGYKARFQTSRPICGPILLGHSAHFGLGQFRPVPGGAA